MTRKTIVLFVLGFLLMLAGVIVLLYEKNQLQQIIDGEIDLDESDLDENYQDNNNESLEVEKCETEPAKVQIDEC